MPLTADNAREIAEQFAANIKSNLEKELVDPEFAYAYRHAPDDEIITLCLGITDDDGIQEIAVSFLWRDMREENLADIFFEALIVLVEFGAKETKH